MTQKPTKHQHTVSKCYLKRWGITDTKNPFVWKLDLVQKDYHDQIELRPVSKLTTGSYFYESYSYPINAIEHFYGDFENYLSPLLIKLNQQISTTSHICMSYEEIDILGNFIILQRSRTKSRQKEVKTIIHNTLHSKNKKLYSRYKKYKKHIILDDAIGSLRNKMLSDLPLCQFGITERNFNQWLFKHYLFIANDLLITSDEPVIAMGERNGNDPHFCMALGPKLLLISRGFPVAHGRPLYAMPWIKVSKATQEQIDVFNKVQIASALHQCYSCDKKILTQLCPKNDQKIFPHNWRNIMLQNFNPDGH